MGIGEAEAPVRIRRVSAWPAEEIAVLYREGGWWQEEWDLEPLADLIAGSFLFLVAVDSSSGRAVGMGRAISDGTSDAYLQDVVVSPAWRGKGIGSRLIGELIRGCREAEIAWIACIAEPGTESFYAPFGFERMEGHVPMRLTGGSLR